MDTGGHGIKDIPVLVIAKEQTNVRKRVVHSIVRCVVDGINYKTMLTYEGHKYLPQHQ
jgi:hypothetical protein